MVKALRATGASPEEIAGLMSQAMNKGGATDEDVVRILAASMAEAGASSMNRIIIFSPFLLPFTTIIIFR